MSVEDRIAKHSKVLAIVTPTFNSSIFIESCINSVDSQEFLPFEHFIIDGDSEDETLSLIKPADYRIVRSEKDNGLYDAMNKGVSKISAQYVIVLNSDDYFHNEKVTLNILNELKSNDFPDILCGSIEFINRVSHKKIRTYKSKNIRIKDFLYGIAPPHPAVVFKRSLFLELGGFNLDFKIAADFDLLLRAFTRKSVRVSYSNMIVTTMRTGGTSDRNLYAHYLGYIEKKRSLLMNGYKANNFKLLLGYLEKAKQFFSH